MKKMATKPFTRSTPLACQITREVRADGTWMEVTDDVAGKKKTVTHSDGYWREEIYDENGRVIKLKSSNGWLSEKIRDKEGDIVATKNSDEVYQIRPDGELWLREVSKEQFDNFINNHPEIQKK